MNYTVRLSDDTVGKIYSEKKIFEGDLATIDITDENGRPIQVTGKVIEILEENEY